MKTNHSENEEKPCLAMRALVPILANWDTDAISQLMIGTLIASSPSRHYVGGEAAFSPDRRFVAGMTLRAVTGVVSASRRGTLASRGYRIRATRSHGAHKRDQRLQHYCGRRTLTCCIAFPVVPQRSNHA